MRSSIVGQRKTLQCHGLGLLVLSFGCSSDSSPGIATNQELPSAGTTGGGIVAGPSEPGGGGAPPGTLNEGQGGNLAVPGSAGTAGATMSEPVPAGGAPALPGGLAGGPGTGAAGAPVSIACEAGLTACGQNCVDLMAALEHCGACNTACTGGRLCVNGGCQCPDDACTELPAFPGADGAAANVTGGRGGTVYHVTRLDTDFTDVAVGTLRYGLTQLTGSRTIVFDVSGVISLGRLPEAGYDPNANGWDTQSRLSIPSDVTIAGQTAPGPLIIMGGLVQPEGTNIILRNVSFAPGYGNRSFNDPGIDPAVGDFPDSFVYDALDISGQRIMIDHVTTVYATDETISMNEEASDITIQYSNISQGQNYPQADAEATGVTYTGHALGSLLQAGSNARISVHHNLYAHQKGRLPRVGTEADVLTVAGVGAFNDFRNNVFYNWFDTAGTGASAQASQNNFINNFYLAGPGGDDPVGGASTAVAAKAGGLSIFAGSDATNTRVYHAGNLKDINGDGDALDGLTLLNGDFVSSNVQASAFAETPYVGVTEPADVAFSRVLDFVGARWWSRSVVDARLVSEVRTGSGQIVAWADDPFDASPTEGVEWRALATTGMMSRPAGFDTDADGMPDDWELTRGLDPLVADNNGDFDLDGYTNLEEYINEIAAWPAATQTLFLGTTNRRYAQITNWNLAPASATPRAGTGRSRGLYSSGGSTVNDKAYWQPSRFDIAVIATGSVLVDAVGQHAGTLEVGAIAAPGGAHSALGPRAARSSGRAAAGARLHIAHGWLEVARDLRVGASSSGATQDSLVRELMQQQKLIESRLAPTLGGIDQTGGTLLVRRAVVLGGPTGARGAYHLAGGALVTSRLAYNAAGGEFDFTGGVLTAQLVEFDLVNRGGTIAPGASSGLAAHAALGETRITGDLALQAGSLELDVQGAQSDRVHVRGTAELAGELRIHTRDAFSPAPGASWVILTAEAGIRGQFERVPENYSVARRGNQLILTYGTLVSRFHRADGQFAAPHRGEGSAGCFLLGPPRIARSEPRTSLFVGPRFK